MSIKKYSSILILVYLCKVCLRDIVILAKVDFLPPRTRAGTLATQAIACVASVSNRVIARKLDRKQKKRLKGEGRGEEEGGGSFISLPLRRHSFFFLLLSQFSR